MRLDVGPFRAEQLAQAVNCQLLHFIHHFTTAVVATAGQSLRVLVGEDAALRFHHLVAGVVFTGNELDALHLAVVFTGNQIGNLLVAHGLGFAVYRVQKKPKINAV